MRPHVLVTWLAVTACLVAAPSATAFTGDISLTSNPPPDQIYDNTPFTLTASGHSEDTSGAAAIDILREPAGTSTCPNPPDGTDQVTPGAITQSPFSITTDPFQAAPHGSLEFCAWIEDANFDPSTVAASAPFTIDVKPADTIAVSVAPNPSVDGLNTTLSVSGKAYSFARAYVTTKPNTPGASCGASPGVDTGTSQLTTDTYLSSTAPSYEGDTTATFSPGDWLVCGWLMDFAADLADPPIVPPTSTVFHVAAVTASASIHAPGTVNAGDNATIAVDYSASGPRQLFVTAQPASLGDCAASYATNAAKSVVLSGSEFGVSDFIGGESSHSGTKTYTLLVGENVVICAWIAKDSTSPTDFGPVSARVNAKPPPPPLPYRGKTSQHRKFAMLIAGDRIVEMAFSERFHCPHTVRLPGSSVRWDGTEKLDLSADNFGDLRIDKGGRFDAKLNGNKNNRIEIRGRRIGKSVSGWFKAKGRVSALIGGSNPTFCTSGRVHFKLHRTKK